MHHGEHCGEVDEGGDRRGLDHIPVGNAQEFRHDEGHGPHDRRGEHTSGRGAGLDGASEGGRVTHALHQRDGEGAGGRHVGDRAARDRGHEGARHHRRLGGTADLPAHQPVGDVLELLAHAGAHDEGAEDDEQNDERSGDADRYRVDALFFHEQVVDDQRPIDRRAVEDAEEVLAIGALQDEERAEQHHDPADRAPRRIHDQKDHDHADGQVHGIGQTPAIYEGENIPADIGLHADGQRDAGDVVGEPAIDRLFPRLAPGRLQEDAQHDHQSDVHRTMQIALRLAEISGVEVEDGKGDANHRDQRGGDDRVGELTLANEKFETTLVRLRRVGPGCSRVFPRRRCAHLRWLRSAGQTATGLRTYPACRACRGIDARS